MRSTAEDYVRPVTGSSEPTRAWLPVLRFRLVAGILLLVVALGVVYVVRALSGEFDGNPIANDGSAQGLGAMVLHLSR